MTGTRYCQYALYQDWALELWAINIPARTVANHLSLIILFGSYLFIAASANKSVTSEN